MNARAIGCLLLLAWLVTARAQSVTSQIDAIISRTNVAGNTWSMIAENEDGSAVYYQHEPDTTKAPASLMKIVTSSAAFSLLGTNSCFESLAYGHGAVEGGVLHGDLNLLVKHDITWNEDVFGKNGARKPLDFIAAQLQSQGLTNIQGNVQIYGACVYKHTSGSYTRLTNQVNYNAEGAQAFFTALTNAGITVMGKALGQSGFAAPGKLLYTYKSTNLTYEGSPLRLDVACIAMGKVSHNVMADLLLRHIGYEFTGTDSPSAGQKLVFKFLADKVRLKTNDLAMEDGSGLSRNDRFSARSIITIIRYMLTRYPSWDKILPIGCVDGTIDNRFCKTDGAGNVHAKTGSLRISADLAGYVDNPHDHKRYLFAFLSNNTTTNRMDLKTTRQAIDDAVNVLAAPNVSAP